MTHEYKLNGIFIHYDGENGKAVLTFRDVKTELSGTYPTMNAAIKAGQDLARSQGWRG
jgi:hypothetical protein